MANSEIGTTKKVPKLSKLLSDLVKKALDF